MFTYVAEKEMAIMSQNWQHLFAANINHNHTFQLMEICKYF